MDAPHPGRGPHGRGPVAEGDHGQVRRGGGEPAGGIPAPAAVLTGTGHRQRMQRLHQHGPQARHRPGQVGAHPPGDAGGPEKAVVRGAVRDTGRVRGRRTLDKPGAERRASQANQLPRGRRSARPGHRRNGPARPAHLLTRIGDGDCSRRGRDQVPAAAARAGRASQPARPSRRTASPADAPPGSPASARSRPAALPSPHAARSAAARRSRAGLP